MFNDIYKNRKVLVTGHTGFKGSWLCLWLSKLGTKIIGYSLDPPTIPCHYELLKLNIISIKGDIRDRNSLLETIKTYKPEIIFHLAAQSIVRDSYQDPIHTFETNIMGTWNLLEVCRRCESIKAIVNITSDKCYENRGWLWGYRENDKIGGDDPYSASKACAEIITNSYRKSFFKHGPLLASVRSGNAIGGGDWAKDRLVPDIVRAIIGKKELMIRNPAAIRPWQHVLEPISGYLLLGKMLLENKKEYADAWNFGPNEEMDVLALVSRFKKKWKRFEYRIDGNPKYEEAKLLKLDSSKARIKLGWTPVWDLDKTISVTIRWYREFYENERIMSEFDLEEYINDAKKKNVSWIN